MLKKTILILLISLMLMGCNIHSPTILPEETGDIVIQALNLPTTTESKWTAHILLSRGKHQLTRIAEVDGNNFTTTMSIPAGTWDISLHLLDEQGVINYQDTLKDITIHPQQNETLNFQLRPADGQLKLIVDLTAYPNSEQIHRIRVHFNDQVKEITRSEVSEPLVGEYSLSPGSYDFKVELFTESFRVGDKVDPGVWQTLHIEPSSQQTINWLPIMEQLTIIADIITIPAAPQYEQVSFLDQQVFLKWSASSSKNVTGYLIYYKNSPFESFQLLAAVTADSLEYIHDLSQEDELPYSFTYCIQSLAGEINGYRTEEIQIILN